MVARASCPARRGFTLVEVLVASAVGLIILTAMMGYLLHRARMALRRCLETNWFAKQEGAR